VKYCCLFWFVLFFSNKIHNGWDRSFKIPPKYIHFNYIAYNLKFINLVVHEHVHHCQTKVCWREINNFTVYLHTKFLVDTSYSSRGMSCTRKYGWKATAFTCFSGWRQQCIPVLGWLPARRWGLGLGPGTRASRGRPGSAA